MENNVCVISWIFLVILTSVLTRANNEVSNKYALVKLECKSQTPDSVVLIKIDVVTASKSGQLVWIKNGVTEVDYNILTPAAPYVSGIISKHLTYLSIILTGFDPRIDATFNCSITTLKDGKVLQHSNVIKPSFIDGKTVDNYGRSVDNYCAGKVPTPVIIVVIILAILVLFLAFVAIKFICIDQGRCRALYSPMLPSYSHHTYSQKEDNYNFSQGNNHYSVAWNGGRTTKEGGSRMMLGSSKSLSKNNFPYRSHNGSVRSVPPRMPQPPPPPPPPLPRDGPPKKLPAHQSNGSLQSSVTYALPQDAIDEELPTPPQDAIDQELPALPKDVTELGIPATGEEDGTDVSSEHYKVPKDSSVNRLSCSL